MHKSYQAIEAPHDCVHESAQAVVNAVKAEDSQLAREQLEKMEQYNRDVSHHIRTMSESLLEDV